MISREVQKGIGVGKETKIDRDRKEVTANAFESGKDWKRDRLKQRERKKDREREK